MSFLDDYEPVEDRLAKFWADHPSGRVVTDLIDDAPIIIFRASLYRADDASGEPWSTGHAHQRILDAPPSGRGGKANDSAPEWTSPFEVCETSAVGRALANAGYAPKGKRPSREEMAAAKRNEGAPKLALDELKARVDLLDPATRDRFVTWKNDQGFPFPWPQTAVDAMHRELDKITAVAGGPDAPSPGIEGAPPSSASLLSASPPAGGEPHGYELWSKDDLAAECKERELPFSQTKERMVRELRAWDQAYNPEAVEHDARPF